jgi:elongation factor Ts
MKLTWNANDAHYDTLLSDLIVSLHVHKIGASGKPADILEKIVNGRLRKFYEAVCLTEQPHMVEDGNPKVSKVLDSLGIDVQQFASQSVS